MIHPNMSKDNLSRFSPHSLQVWACVLLDVAGMSPKFIMLRLRWMGNSFWMYLRDAGMIQDKHRDIFRAESQEVLDLIAGPTLTLLPSLTRLSIVDVDETMGEYADDMDWKTLIWLVFLISFIFNLHTIIPKTNFLYTQLIRLLLHPTHPHITHLTKPNYPSSLSPTTLIRSMPPYQPNPKG